VKELITHGGGWGDESAHALARAREFKGRRGEGRGRENLRGQSRGESADRHDEGRNDALCCTCHAIEQLRASKDTE
jgi:hypothetical protein